MKFSNKQNSIIVVIVSILCGVLIVLSSFNYKEKVIKDNIKFSKEYNLVSEDNVFVYKNIDEIIKIMENNCLNCKNCKKKKTFDGLHTFFVCKKKKVYNRKKQPKYQIISAANPNGNCELFKKSLFKKG